MLRRHPACALALEHGRELIAVIALLASFAAGAQTATMSDPATSSGYDLTARLAEVPFQVALPAAPRTKRSITVTSEAELRTAFATAGADITVQPRAACYSGNFSTGNDQRIRFQAGANICGPAASKWIGALTVSSQRVHISGPGGVLGGSFIMAATAQDIRLDQRFTVTTKTSSPDHNMDQVHLGGTRVLLEGVSITSRTYCGYSAGAANMVIANSSLVSLGGHQSCLRIVGGTRVVVMDNRLVNPTHHTFRVHSRGATQPSDYVYFARNQLEGRMGIMSNNSAGNPDPQSLHTWYIDNRLYGGMVMVAPAPGNTTAVVTGNQQLPRGTEPPAWSAR